MQRPPAPGARLQDERLQPLGAVGHALLHPHGRHGRVPIGVVVMIVEHDDDGELGAAGHRVVHDVRVAKQPDRRLRPVEILRQLVERNDGAGGALAGELRAGLREQQLAQRRPDPVGGDERLAGPCLAGGGSDGDVRAIARHLGGIEAHR